MDLKEVVQQEFNNMVESGKVQQIITEKLTKTVDDIFGDALKSWSDFGKQLKQKVTAAINVDLSHLDLLDYTQLINGVVKTHLDNTLYASAVPAIEGELKSYLGYLEKNEWKLSEIIEKFISEEVQAHDSSKEGEISLHVETSSGGSIHVYFDEDEGKSSYKCGYQLDMMGEKSDNGSAGKVYAFKTGDYRKATGDIVRESMHGAFTKFMFKLYAQGARVIIDTEDVQREYCSESSY